MIRISTLIAIMLFGISGANAATLTVTNTNDVGTGSLRDAIDLAIAGAGTDNIVFAIPTSDGGYHLPTNRFTITLSSSLPTLPAETTTIVNGQSEGMTIRGNGTFRIFTLNPSAVVVMANLTISLGASANGGGIYTGANSSLTLNLCELSNNTSSFTGGAISTGNSASLKIYRSTLVSNTAVHGAVLYTDSFGTVNVDKSTFSGNTAQNSGGAIFLESGSHTVTNNTFSGNTAVSGEGGAIFNIGTMGLTSNTIAGNTAATGGGISNRSSATLVNNIVALNTASGSGPDLRGDGTGGTIAFSGTYNLIGNIDGSGGLINATNMWGNTGASLDPSIGPLAHNGGSTQTHALLFDSFAIDQGNSSGITTDQRGFARPVVSSVLTSKAVGGGDFSDMGSFEFASSPTSAEVSITGRIITMNGKSVSGVTGAVIVATSPDGLSWSARSNGFGYYELSGLPVSTSYIISVTKKRHSFEPKIVTVMDGIQGFDFISN